MKCPNCGAETSGQYCPFCGTKVNLSNTCANCGMEFIGNFCPFCGAPAGQSSSAQQQEEYQQSTWHEKQRQNEYHQQTEYQQTDYRQAGYQKAEYQAPQYREPPIIINNTPATMQDRRFKNKWIAFFLCLFLGAIGVHKFYEGKIGMGILYLFTGGLAGIGVIIDLITLLSKPEYYLP